MHEAYTYFFIYCDDRRAEIAEEINRLFNVVPEPEKYGFRLGVCRDYNIDINEMLRATLKNLIGRENKLNDLKLRFSLEYSLIIVANIAFHSESPKPVLSLDDDIIEFLYKTKARHDLDYYII